MSLGSELAPGSRQPSATFILHKVFLKSFFRSQVAHNLSVTIINMKNDLINLFGGVLLQNDFENTLCGINLAASCDFGKRSI